MQISENGLNLIKQFEGCKLTAYLDQVGVLTIGYGSTDNVWPGLVISEEDATDRLISKLETIYPYISGAVKVSLSQNQFDALCSFCYNLGSGALTRSTLLKVLNEGDYQAAADNFLKWDMAGGKVDPGLERRRNAERSLFLS